MQNRARADSGILAKPLKLFCCSLFTSALVVWASTLFAATVVVVRPTSTSPQATEMLTFLRGELLSVGFDTLMAERPGAGNLQSSDPREWLGQLAVEHGAIAVIDILGEQSVAAVDVWVLKTPGRFEVTRVAVDPETTNSSVRLAIRALEALRASLVEVDFRDRYRPRQRQLPPSTIAPSEGPPALPADAHEHIGLEVGGTALMSLDGVGPTFLPVVGVDWAARTWLVVHATMAGMGTRATVTTSAGSARIAQQYAVLGGSYRFRPERSLWPLVSIGTGVLHTSIEGQSIRGERSNGDGQWSLLADMGFGVGMRLYRSYRLTLSGHVQVAHPYIAVHFGDPVVATAGHPNVHFDLTVGAWL